MGEGSGERRRGVVADARESQLEEEQARHGRRRRPASGGAPNRERSAGGRGQRRPGLGGRLVAVPETATGPSATSGREGAESRPTGGCTQDCRPPPTLKDATYPNVVTTNEQSGLAARTAAALAAAAASAAAAPSTAAAAATAAASFVAWAFAMSGGTRGQAVGSGSPKRPATVDASTPVAYLNMVQERGSRTWFKNVVQERGSRTWFKNMVQERGSRSWFKNVVQERGSRTRFKNVVQERGSQKNVVQERGSRTWFKNVVQ